MKKLIAAIVRAAQWVRKYWYFLIIAFAVLTGILLGFIIGRPRQGMRAVNDFVANAKSRIDAVDCETMQAKAEVKAKSLEEKIELRVIMKQPDVRERRKALAKFLETL